MIQFNRVIVILVKHIWPILFELTIQLVQLIGKKYGVTKKIVQKKWNSIRQVVLLQCSSVNVEL